MNRTITLLIAVLAAVAASFITMQWMPAQQATTPAQSVYDRVMQNGVIRCGYFSWYPSVVKDATTGQMKGIAYDVMNAIGKATSLRIDWAEELSFADFPAALATGRIDAMCAGIWPTGDRSRAVDFIDPLYFLPLHAFAQADDNLFREATDIATLNDSQYTIAILEGGATATIQRQNFPNAKVFELPQLTSPSELFVSLAQGKADFIIYDRFTFHEYDDNNPGKLKRISTKPVKIFPNAVAIKRNEFEFRQMLNHSLRELQLNGALDEIVARHQKHPGTLLGVAQPYVQ